MPTGIVCPKCGGEVVKIGAAKGRRPFWGCSNWRAEDEKKKCDFRLYQPPVLEPCPKCAAKFLVQAGGKTRPVLKCIKEGCGFEKPFTPSDEEGAILAAGADDGDGEEKPATASKRPPARKSKRATSPPDATAS